MNSLSHLSRVQVTDKGSLTAEEFAKLLGLSVLLSKERSVNNCLSVRVHTIVKQRKDSLFSHFIVHYCFQSLMFFLLRVLVSPLHLQVVAG